jgi:CO/xanthine dehydrogenase FAD-binding subunit
MQPLRPVSLIAPGAVADRSARCTDAEAALAGTPVGREAFETAAAVAAQLLDPLTDVQGSGAYRQHRARGLVGRAPIEAWPRALAVRGRSR